MSTFSTIDLSQLPPPTVIEELDYEQILAERKRRLIDLHPIEQRPEISAALELESEPVLKLLQENAYREMVLRNRINDAARAVMLAFANDADLDHLGARDNLARLLLDAGDPNATPPRPPAYESNTDFRRRIQMSPEGYTTAGSLGSYTFHGLSADADVADVRPVSPAPGVVTVYVLSRSGNGAAGPTLLSAVDAALSREEVRPMTDQVSVQSVSVVEYQIAATLIIQPGPDSAVVSAAAHAAAERYAAERHAIGRDVTLSGVYAALHQPGVQQVNLTQPVANLVIGHGEASYCTGITLTAEEAASD